MAGIRVPQYEIFKIGTDKLKYYGWDLTISKADAFKYQEFVALFEAQEFRLIADKILCTDISEIDFSKVFLQVIIEKKSDFARATGKKGITVNGCTFKRFVGTTGGLKNNTILYCNVEYLEELNRLCECGRNPNVKLVPAKYEAYKALTCSASQPICEPNGILVVPDCVTKYTSDVITLDDGVDSDEPTMKLVKNKPLENNATDGFNLCTIGYMERIAESLGLDYVPSGVCLRNAWLKGMLYPFPISEFCKEFNGGDYMVRDIWGDVRDIRECEMILTESSFKLWSAYNSIDDYIENYRRCGYGFSVTKFAPEVLEEERELNYQYLQSYEFTDEDIEELCAPTVKFLQDSMGGDYSSTLHFLGITEDTEVNTWQRALYSNEYMLGDPYIIDCINRFIKKKVNDAKTGKLFANGNYQIASGDPFAMMQSVCGLEVTGLLSSGECYSKFWIDKDEDELVIFRSPMTSHNNIRKCRVNSSKDCRFWYQYMDTIIIINAWDTFCMAENGSDYDSDILFSTNNPVLKRRFRDLPAIECVQRNAEKVLITEEEICKSNKNGLGNKVGMITNFVTSMMEVQANFEPGSKEYEELEYRITCGQLYQQNSLDGIKGIVTSPMPSRWYNLRACADDRYLQSICASKKPYFMIYIYEKEYNGYRAYIRETNEKCKLVNGCTIQELKDKESKTDEENDFLFWYEYKIPVGNSDCSMNRICHYVEDQLDGYKKKLRQDSKFDYEKIKVECQCSEEHRREISKLERDYRECLLTYRQKKVTGKGESKISRHYLYHHFNDVAREICPDDDERMNIVLDICYKGGGSKQFCWDVAGELICKRLEGMRTVYNE